MLYIVMSIIHRFIYYALLINNSHNTSTTILMYFNLFYYRPMRWGLNFFTLLFILRSVAKANTLVSNRVGKDIAAIYNLIF